MDGAGAAVGESREVDTGTRAEPAGVSPALAAGGLASRQRSVFHTRRQERMDAGSAGQDSRDK